MKVQGGGCCPPTGLSDLVVGMQHILSCAHFLQQTLLLEQLWLAATGTGAPVSCVSKGRQQHPISPLLPVKHKQFLKEVLTQMPSPVLAGSFPLGRQTWSVHSLTGILAFSLSFLAGLWLQPGKLTFLSGRKIREESVFEIKLFTVYITSVILISSIFFTFGILNISAYRKIISLISPTFCPAIQA